MRRTKFMVSYTDPSDAFGMPGQDAFVSRKKAKRHVKHLRRKGLFDAAFMRMR